MSRKIKTEFYNESVKNLGSGDSYLIKDFLTKEESDVYQKNLMNEIEWGSFNIKGNAVPRLVSVQGELQGNGTYPIYRHPVDDHIILKTWCPTAEKIKLLAEKATGQTLNHSLIQLYRDGKDFISDHSDKTLDITHNTDIVTVSVGETRVLVLKSKDKDHIQEIELTHGSLYVLGWRTNMEYLHGIRRNADPQVTLQPRISLTLRNIATFIRRDGKMFGQGAICKKEEDLDKEVVKIKELKEDATNMLKLFSQMNKKKDTETFKSNIGFSSLTYGEHN